MTADRAAPCALASSPRRRALPFAAAAVLGLAGAAFLSPAPAVVAAEPAPELTLFRDRIEPVLQNVCSQCHAGQGKGEFKLIVHAPGIALSDDEERTNYRTILKLLVPGKPDQSKFLLKPLAERDGGVKHGGGDRIYKGTAAYRNWVEFITSVKAVAPESAAAKPGSPAAPKPGAPAAPSMPAMPTMPSMGSAPGQPDLGFFAARVEPVLLGVCSQCHAGAGKGQFALIVHTGGTRFPLADHQKNFDTVLKLLVPGKPDQSKFLLKPLAERDGGVKHGGGDRISKGDPNYLSWVDFINGVKGPPPPSDANPEESLPSVSDKGLTLEMEEGKLSGDAAATPIEGAPGTCVAPGAAGGRVALRFRAGRRGDYTLAFRALAAPRGFRVRVDGGEFLDVAPPKEGWAEVGPVLPLDDGKPLDGRLGRLAVVAAAGAEGAAIQMDGREGMARWLSPADLPHARVEATVAIPGDDLPGRDDAWLLFDCLDRENGKFFGLVDGGRKLAMGVIEGGRPRILKTAPAPAGIGGDKPFTLSVDLLDGVAVGRLDGKPAVGVNFDRGLGAARFGFLTHGIATVSALVARRGADEVHRAKFSSGGVLHLVKGTHALEVELLPQGAALDTVLVKEVSSP